MDEKGRYSVKTIAEYIIDYCDKHLGGVSNLRSIFNNRLFY